jgi:hypothetical protein
MVINFGGILLSVGDGSHYESKISSPLSSPLVIVQGLGQAVGRNVLFVR